MSNHTSRTTSAKIICERVVGRTPTTISPNSKRRSFNGDSPTRCSISKCAASRAIKSKSQVSSKTNSTTPAPLAKRRPIKGGSTRIMEHSNEKEMTTNSVSTLSLVGGSASRHLRKMPESRFAQADYWRRIASRFHQQFSVGVIALMTTATRGCRAHAAEATSDRRYNRSGSLSQPII